MFPSLKPAMIALAATLTFAACEPTALNTPQSIASEGQQGQQLVRQLQQQNGLVKDAALNSYVQGIVQRISAARGGGVPIRTYIVRDADVNAFTPGGGYLFVNAGLIATMENEAQLATVLAHEIAHVDRGHIQAQQARRTGVGLGATAAAIGGALLGLPPQLTEFGVNLGTQYAVNSFTREQEADADVGAGQYLAAAGYSVTEGANSFDVLRRISGGSGGGFLSSHPATGDRQQAMVAAAAQLGATGGRIGAAEYNAATRSLRQQLLNHYQQQGQQRAAAVVAANLQRG